jgi:hypothetical protein
LNKELDKQLCERYPHIFKHRNASITYSLMGFGFEVGDGWFNLIDGLCRTISNHVDGARKQCARTIRYNRAVVRAQRGDLAGLRYHYTIVGEDGVRFVPDWAEATIKRDLQNPTLRALPPAMPHVRATQVKEKFGGLRFYVSGADEYVHGAISMAESMSYRTCEVCGSPGKVYRDGWFTTLCPTHAAEQNRSDLTYDEDE